MGNGQDLADYKADLLDVIEDCDEPLTKNGVAKEMGLSKATDKTVRALDELVSDGKITTGVNSRGNTVYMIGGESGKGVVKSAEGGEEFAEAVPAISRKNYDYVIEPLTGKRFKFRVTAPDGDVQDLAEGERILVVNPGAENQGRFWLSEPADAITAIQRFCNDHGFHQYTIQDLNAGSYVSQDCELDTRPIVIFVDVNRHNKAAA